MKFSTATHYSNGIIEFMTFRASNNELALQKLIKSLEARWGAKFFWNPDKSEKREGRLVNYGGVLYDLTIDCWQVR